MYAEIDFLIGIGSKKRILTIPNRAKEKYYSHESFLTDKNLDGRHIASNNLFHSIDSTYNSAVALLRKDVMFRDTRIRLYAANITRTYQSYIVRTYKKWIGRDIAARLFIPVADAPCTICVIRHTSPACTGEHANYRFCDRS